MLPDYRHPLLRPRVLTAMAQALASAKADLDQLHFQYRCELHDLRRQVDELSSIVADIASTLRQLADADIARMR